MRYMVFDVESIGLYGPPFAFGYVVVDGNGKELSKGFECVSSLDALLLAHEEWEKLGFRVALQDLKWVRRHVLPALQKVDFRSSDAFVTSVRYKSQLEKIVRMFVLCQKTEFRKFGHMTLAADCQYPVEANFLRTVMAVEHSYNMDRSPYPVHEVATALHAAGMDPFKTYSRLKNEKPEHHPLMDARQSARLFIKALRSCRAKRSRK